MAVVDGQVALGEVVGGRHRAHSLTRSEIRDTSAREVLVGARLGKALSSSMHPVRARTGALTCW